MTQIKFKAWKISDKFMFDWEDMVVHRWNMDAFEDDDLVFLQYVDMNDKKGIEIYSGDIVTELGMIKVVEWTQEGGGWQFKPIKELVGNYSASIEVIGNIYENPELLEQSL